MSRFKPYILIISLALIVFPLKAQNSPEMALKFNLPARIWEECLPLGNGRLGMMPDGGIFCEKIILNDISMWSGSVDSTAINKDAYKYLPKIRELLLENRNLEAQKLMYEKFRCGGLGSNHGSGKDAPYGSFQILGELNIKYQYKEKSDKTQKYTRKLSLNEAVATTEFEKSGIKFKREYFASQNHDVLIIKISANKSKAVSLNLELSREERANIICAGNSITMQGQLNDGYNGDKGVKYYTKLEAINKGGQIKSNKNSLSISNANEVIIIVSSATSLLYPDFKTHVDNLLEIAKNTNYENLKSMHIAKYKEKFDRVKLNIAHSTSTLSTPKQLIDFQENDNPELINLYFQYGRYLLISGSRENTLPLNLQGLWANQLQTPWNGDYHININLQMNYWPVNVCNLSELNKPLIEFIKSLSKSGEATAKAYYGVNGWVAHVISNPWMFTSPGEHASWGATNTGGAWLCQHLWQEFEYSNDTNYLRSIFPLMLGAAEFFVESMIQEPQNNWYVTAPSSSPENAFYLPDSKEAVFVCMGPSMDMQIIRELFTNVLSASKILDIDNELITQISNILPKLAPMQISEKGYLQEWLYDYEEQDPQHRHVSHLYALFPSNQISPEINPEFAEAARETLNRRGDAGTGWSRAWKINFWARLKDGNRAYKLLKSLLLPRYDMDLNELSNGGTYPNLFCAHPPFQIDGNFGGISGIAEMLVQSQNGYIELLPALPDAWKTGSFSGFKVRGGAEVSLSWENMKIKEIGIKSQTNNTFKIKLPDYATNISCSSPNYKIENRFILVEMMEGEEVRFSL